MPTRHLIRRVVDGIGDEVGNSGDKQSLIAFDLHSHRLALGDAVKLAMGGLDV